MFGLTVGVKGIQIYQELRKSGKGKKNSREDAKGKEIKSTLLLVHLCAFASLREIH